MCIAVTQGIVALLYTVVHYLVCCRWTCCCNACKERRTHSIAECVSLQAGCVWMDGFTCDLLQFATEGLILECNAALVCLVLRGVCLSLTTLHRREAIQHDAAQQHEWV